MTQSKQEIRENAKAYRKRLAVTKQDLDQFAEHFFSELSFDQNDVIATYLPMTHEFDVRDISFQLMDKGCQLCLPVVQKESRVLKFYPWEKDTQFKESNLGVMEPLINASSKDVIPKYLLVPLLAFDQRGYRLGYGGGYYDATLKDLKVKGDICAIGVGYAEQACLFNLPTEDHDQGMDMIITPKHCLKF